MSLYKTGAANIVVSDGTLNNGTGLAVTVGSGNAATLSLGAATTTPTAGTGDNLTVTAFDSFGNTAASYTGVAHLTFSGASASPGGTNPDRHQRHRGQQSASVQYRHHLHQRCGQRHRVQRRCHDPLQGWPASIVVSDGTINNGAGLAVTVGLANAAGSRSVPPIPPDRGRRRQPDRHRGRLLSATRHDATADQRP